MKPLQSKLSVAIATIAVSAGANAAGIPAEKPQTMDEMWKIIQAQQQQIDSMTKKLEAVAQKSPTGEVSNLERKTNVLTEEVEKLRTELVVPEKVEYKSAYGLGPAASKVYQVGKGLSIGGYGEANYQARVDDQGGRNANGTFTNPDNTDVERLVIYTGYKFSDSILFNSEIEFEHASTGNNGSGISGSDTGTVSVEMASLDFFIDPMVNVRAGMLLMPMGFINQIHEPPFYFGNNRPEVERRIIPSTWRENGVGLFGELLPGLTYTTYVVNGMNARNFSASGIRGGRQAGGQALAEDLAYVGRLDYTPPMLPGVMVGGSAYVGNSGQNQLYNGRQLDVATQLYEAHLQWKYRGLEFRTLGSWGHIGDAALLSAARSTTIGEENYGWYSEVGYDILPHFLHDTTQYLAPFVRYERMDTVATVPTGRVDDLTRDVEIYQVGLNYKPIPNVVIKADYRNFTQKSGASPDDFNLGVGFIF
ncbi:hypothetical protein QZJ86_07960 [Methylomonas montana]|uniref:hypothetical protein n=1 Tax=Methylomonas montana TaxID=3058963 RepID=UPI0026580993|nr:hypothetical protein [Methylomonas montana]WKJ92063.1 hypothetical protein QZJ86_07960 [Methylomonas montana]